MPECPEFTAAELAEIMTALVPRIDHLNELANREDELRGGHPDPDSRWRAHLVIAKAAFAKLDGGH